MESVQNMDGAMVKEAQWAVGVPREHLTGLGSGSSWRRHPLSQVLKDRWPFTRQEECCEQWSQYLQRLRGNLVKN